MNYNMTDPHSFANSNDVVVKDLDLDISVDFKTKTISGKASYKIENKTETDVIILDTRDMDIEKVTEGMDETVSVFEMGPEIPFLGKSLKIRISPVAKYIHIYYKTRPEASALQWLEPTQTAGGVHPFLFTQSEAILARTWVPCQDSPGIRFTYSATVQVPVELMAVMSASNPVEKSEDGIYHFHMDEAIPSYLMALSVGDIEFKALESRTGVYAEPVTLAKAAYEFADMEKMLDAAEALYGPYRWEQYDVIVLPPSFPFGGMENPRLTFATPTILSGDRSLVSLIAHELAHSWSGNLVTNATWNDFWLNEGFTVYFERRIMEALEGRDYADMLEVLGYQDLKRNVKEIGETSDDTKLKLHLEDRDPDDGMTQIAYEKGFSFLRLVEENVGRPRFDIFVKQYFNKFAFQSMTTEKFLDYFEEDLIRHDEKLEKAIDIHAWVYEPGIPSNCLVIKSARFEKVNASLASWIEGVPAKDLNTKKWSSHEWLQFIRHLPVEMTLDQMSELDAAFGFTDSGNCEILAAWFEHVIKHQYIHGYASLEKFMVSVGRRKFIVPLYKLLVLNPEGKKMAQDIYKKARPNYHTVATSTIDEIVK